VRAGPASIAAAFQLSDKFKLKADRRKVETVVFKRKQLIRRRIVVNVDLGKEMFL
jgi:hypothetical protein